MKKLLILFIFITALISCQKDNLTENTASSRIIFKLTDAPAAYDKVFIDIVGARVIINDSIIDLNVNTGIYNLLDFVNGKDTVLVDQEIPSGKLSQIRLILGDNNSLMIGNESFDLKTPSAQQSGLKLNVHEDFVQGIGYEYTIDFDASRSIVQTGNGKFILKPVLKVFTKSISGAIAGIVSPANANPLIYAISSQLDTVSTLTDTISGCFKFSGLSEDIYKLNFLPADTYRDTTIENISVTIGMVTRLDTIKFEK